MLCPLRAKLPLQKAELTGRRGGIAQRMPRQTGARSSSTSGDGGDGVNDNLSPSSSSFSSSSRRALLLASTIGAAATTVSTSTPATNAAPLLVAAAAESCKPAAPAAAALASTTTKTASTSAAAAAAAALPPPPPPPSASLEVARARVAVLRAVSSASSSTSESSRNLAGYEAMAALHASNPKLFHSLLSSDRATFLPLVYTPAVADACANWGTLLTRPKGLYLSADDAACAGGRGLRAVVDSWKLEDEEKEKGGKRDSPLLPPRLAVVSDGARILALGDLAAHGMGIPVGKCFLHSAGGGLSPQECLPVIVDAGRGSETERNDLFYLGRRAPRLRGAAYAAFLTEALQALRGRFGPRFIIHLEDFAGRDAAALLEKEEGANLPCFDDDIQATGAAAVAAVLAATRGIEGVPPLADQIFLFLGAGQAAVGVARCAAAALRAPVSEGGAGLSEREARDRMFLVDSKGVVVSATGDKAAAPSASLKAEFARAADDPVVLKLRGNGGSKSPPSLAEIVTAVGPTTLVGAAGVAGAFDSSVLRALATSSPSSFRPIVLALSNPTAFSECTPQEAADATSGRAVFASGSPFADYSVKGDRAARKGLRRASQANNALVFPGVALGLVAADASGLGGGKAEAALLPAARALAGLVTAEDFEEDAVLPRVNLLPAVTRAVAASVALAAIAGGRSGPRCLPALRRAAEKIERARTDGDEAAAEKAALKDAEEAISKIQFDGEAAFATSFA